MKHLIIAVALLLVQVSISHAQEATGRTKQYNLENKLAIQGYDPVAYFKQNSAVKGSKELSTYYMGVIYYFSSPENKAEFKKNPAMYEPQYGGWCAYAMGSRGEKVAIDPGTFKVTNGKLYLFYNKYLNNTLPKWNKDEVNLKNQADLNWSRFVKN
jgi:YHS domain-containing protein